MIGAVILQVILIFLNAVFASAEIAVISMKDAKLELLSEDGNRGAKRLLKLKSDPAKFLSTIQVAITLAGLMGSAYAADNFAEPLVGVLVSAGVTVSSETLESICVFFVTIILSYFSIVFGELVPKRVAMKNAEAMALGLSGLLSGVSRVFAPFVWVLTVSTNLLLRLFGINPDDNGEEVTEEELLMMLETGSERGTIDEAENEMIKNIFEFDDTPVSEVCTHRRDVTVLYTDEEPDEWMHAISETKHSYYPICGDGPDNVLGVLNMKKFFYSDKADMRERVRESSEKALFVPHSMKTDVLFDQMRREKRYYAVVVDEYGGTGGVVTMNGLLELLVGDLTYTVEADEELRQIDDTTWAVGGRAPLDEVAQKLDVDIDSDEWDTFGGYIMGISDRVPEDGESFTVETEELTIRVDSVRDRRIEKTTVTVKENKEKSAMED